jgi:hypothetical protein
MDQNDCFTFPIARDDTMLPMPSIFGVAQSGQTAVMCVDLFY